MTQEESQEILLLLTDVATKLLRIAQIVVTVSMRPFMGPAS